MGALKNVRKFFVSIGLKKMKGTVIVVGLQNSGKSTIVNCLKNPEDKLQEVAPTVGFSVEQVYLEKCKLTVVDMSGHKKYTRLWECYYQDAQAIVFVLDATDSERMSEAKDVLMEVIVDERLQKLPLVVLANKADLPQALSAVDVSENMDLNHSLHAHKSWNVFATSGLTGEGLKEGMRWMLTHLKKR
mmetsp:Transcript_27546/g.38026  ORF Transcript_27546/g.38026 Transcript_27546/m.38026 type:complete len:188 (-) Transcript_27546:105-668(-)|eukprot:CAMPEP_0196574138 /NCGR_PEP_ID=MMETSP1081-20130531/3910_1 /TAXON_ID=36882 /ORGANISM="Pyramimonas amylifera, Strain CCMP720" /LENGTH=187 /DNA_ID=CAMNT_0041892067 /DNA_START=125 /DNA_END=688 /DNA_ORIENTATION=-